MTTPLDTIVITPEPMQMLALAARSFPVPEISRKGPSEYLAFTIREDGQWVEALGRSPIDALDNVIREVARR